MSGPALTQNRSDVDCLLHKMNKRRATRTVQTRSTPEELEARSCPGTKKVDSLEAPLSLLCVIEGGDGGGDVNFKRTPHYFHCLVSFLSHHAT